MDYQTELREKYLVIGDWSQSSVALNMLKSTHILCVWESLPKFEPFLGKMFSNMEMIPSQGQPASGQA